MIDSISAAFTGDRLALHAGDVPEDELWAQLTTFTELPRLVVVREAHRLTQWQYIPDVHTASREVGTRVLFISSDDDFWEWRKDQSGKTVRGDRWPGADAVQEAGGQLIRCQIGEDNKKEREAWVRRQLPGITDTLADEILSKCGGRLDAVKGVCTKIRAAGLRPDREGLTWTLDELPPSELAADLILLMRPAEALKVIADTGVSGHELVIHVASRLDLMLTVREAEVRKLTAQQAREGLNLLPNLRQKFKPVVGDYGPQSVARRRALLATLDYDPRHGARDGVAEALAALW